MPAVEASFRAVLGSEPALEDFTDTIAYYDLPPPAGPVRPGRSTAEVIAAAQNLIKEVFNHGRQTLKAMQDAVISNINTEYDALIAAAQKAGDVTEVAELTKKKANSLSEYRTLMRMGNKGPYAPLKRFGNYVVVGRSQAYLDQESIRDNPKSAPDQIAEANKKLRELEKNQDHYFVQFAETMGEAKAISRDEEANYALVEPFEKDSSRGALFGGADVQGLFYRLRNMVEDTQDSNTTDKSERTINRLLSDLHLSLLSEQSARQSEKRRRKIAGAEKDMMRAFATQGRATAHFISSLENSEEIYDSLRDMKSLVCLVRFLKEHYLHIFAERSSLLQTKKHQKKMRTKMMIWMMTLDLKVRM